MKLTNTPTLRTEDFAKEQSWISKLFIQLNPVFSSLNQIMDQNIDFSTNIKAVTKDYTVTNGFTEFSFAWSFSGFPPLDLRVIKAFKGTQNTPTILLAAWEYDASESSITIKRMTEINSDSVSSLSGRYQFTIRATV